MSETITIGIDHGYAAMKSTHFSFPSGLVEYEHEAYTQKDVLEYGGKYYVVGSGRQPLQKNKTLTEDYYLLTLAAIARELEFRKADRTASVHLAAGLPLTSFGRDKKKFQDYLLRDGAPVSFRFEGVAYTVTVTGISLFPQGYAAVLTQPELLDEPSVILADIGGWTVDLMRLDNRVPNAATCRSLELGMIRCLDEIAEQIRRNLGLSMTAAQIESVLRSEVTSVDGQAKEIICREADAYVHRLLSAIAESGLDARAMPAVFLGGGAALFRGPRRNPAKRLRWGEEEQRSERAFAAGRSEGYGACDDDRYVRATDGLCRPLILDDVCLNAKGYERLVGLLSRNRQDTSNG